jgi:mRNA-degrading endonuclease toxin of MazEF toxin-antitoxin module
MATIPVAELGEQIGRLPAHHEPKLSNAIRLAFDLD